MIHCLLPVVAVCVDDLDESCCMDFARTDDADQQLDDEGVIHLPEAYPRHADANWEQLVYAARQVGCLVLSAHVHLEVGAQALSAHVDPKVFASLPLLRWPYGRPKSHVAVEVRYVFPLLDVVQPYLQIAAVELVYPCARDLEGGYAGRLGH